LARSAITVLARAMFLRTFMNLMAARHLPGSLLHAQIELFLAQRYELVA